MKYQLTLIINELPKIITNGSQGSFWYKVAEKKKWLKLIAFHIGTDRPRLPLTKCKIECVRHSSVRSDFDNLSASFKYSIDALVKCKILIDDNDNVIVERKYRWEKAAPKAGFITITVEEI